MSPAFIKGIEEAFPKAHITFDKVCRQEQNDEPILKETRYLWLKNARNLSNFQLEKLIKLKDSHLKTAKAYRLRLALQAM